jgi:phosphonopyruvate decarboxylase
MMRAELLIEELRRAGFGLFSGVPCSYLTPLINAVIDSPHAEYIGAANEGEAVAIAAGAQLGGVRGVVMFQNSGLGNAVSPLTSLNAIFRIPILLIVTWRGEPGGPTDEPQHGLMGPITPDLLDLMQVPWELFPKEEAAVPAAIDRAVAHMETTGTPFAFILRKGLIGPHELQTRADLKRSFCLSRLVEDTTPQPRLNVDEVLKAIQSSIGLRDVMIATTGFTGRALYACGDHGNQFYMVGSMGCASSLALGLARARPDHRVIVLDGDGAALMRLGALAVLGHERPDNLIHVLLDNGVHDSTGAQATVSSSIDFATLAAACGYSHVRRIADLDDLQAELAPLPSRLSFLHVLTQPRADSHLPRPTITPPEVAQRLQHWMGVSHASLATHAPVEPRACHAH